MQIFVSSVARDLKSEREAVIRQILKLGDRPIGMEYFGSTPQPPLEECLAKVEECDLMVLILGTSYGSVHAGTGISYTESEFRHAKQLGIEVLVFTVDDLTEKIDSCNDADSADKYKRFFQSVQAAHTYERFSGADQLSTAVVTGIANYKQEHGELGRRLVPFVSWTKFFELLLDSRKFFNHNWALVGRADVLSHLQDFVGSDKKIGVLYGAGGLGKSRLLLEFARNSEKTTSGWKLLFLSEFTPWTLELVKALPAAPCLIVIDEVPTHSTTNGQIGD